MGTGKELKVGDVVRVVARVHGHGFNIGERIRVTKADPKQNFYIGDSADRREEGWAFTNDEVVLVEVNPKAVDSEPPEVDFKDTNPKDAIGSTKLSYGLVPDTLTTFAALAFTEGATKYGSYNWRVAGVRASIYRDALERHLKKWWNGEEVDPQTGVPHLASVIACAGIILDAALVGKLTDDRPPKAPVSELIDAMQPKVAHLKELHKDKNPKHQTALDQAS